jgi:hypothetical protein
VLISNRRLRGNRTPEKNPENPRSDHRDALTLTLTLAHTQKRGDGQRRTYLVLLAPPTVGVHGTPVR